jgi:hypothetical protein
MKKSILTLSVIIIVTCLLTFAFLQLNNANSSGTRTSDMAKLQDDYDALQTKYYALLGNYSNLEYEYQNVLLQNPSLSVPNPADSGSADTQQMLSRYQALQQMYINLINEYNQYIANYQKLKATSDVRLMQGDLRSLVTPNDPEIINLVRNITGKVNSTDVNNYWKDIKSMYDWVDQNIEYRDDGLYVRLPDDPADVSTDGLPQTNQMAQLPNETLTLKMGDCEDYAVLLVSMIRAYFGQQNYLAECIWITGEHAGHVAIVIPVSGEKIIILDPIRDYYSHDTLGNMAENTISSEIYNWMQIWRPSLGNDVHVYRIFSDYMDKTFTGTQAYVDWMYNGRH